MSLRILYHHRIRAEDGQAVHVRELIAALRRRGHEVRECALVQKTIARNENGAARPSFWQKLRLPRAAVEALEIGYNGKARAMLQNAASGWKPDFVYERHALHCRAGLDTARKLGVPLLLEVNSPMTDEMERLGLLTFARRARATERLVLGAADRVLAVTQALGDRLVPSAMAWRLAQQRRKFAIGGLCRRLRSSSASLDSCANGIASTWRSPR